jgi:ribosomal protein L7/L12/outer membrane protein assembly factor BamB
MTDATPTSLNCPACGAPLDYDGTSTVLRCKFCGNVSILPVGMPGAASAPAGALDEIRRLAADGNLIEAIKKYRRIYGASLQEAKDAVEALQAGRLASPSAPGMPPAEELTKVIQEVQRLIGEGKKIEAIKVYRENYDVSATRASYAVEQIEAGQTVHPESGFESFHAAEPVSTGRPRRWVGWVAALAIFALVGGIIALTLFQPGGPFNPHYYANDKTLLLSTNSGASPDMAVWLYDPQAENRFIGLLSGENGKLAWKAAPLTGDGFIDGLAAGQDMIYAVSGTDLLAYRRGDGSLAWQARMTDRLNYTTTALLVTPARVITNNADQTLQAYNADNGSPAWNMRLSGYDRGLRQVDGSLMVIDYVGDNYTYGLIFLDLFSGSQQNTVYPTCTYNDYESTIDPDSGFVYDSAGKALYLVYDSSYGCVQRIDPTTGEAAWSTSVGESFNFSPDGFQYLLTDTSLYFSSGNEIMAVDKATGEMRTLLSDPDFALVPLAESGTDLIVRARRTRGTEKFELWKVEEAPGTVGWKLDLRAAKPIDPPNEMAGLVDKTDWGFTWRLTPAGLVVIRFQGEPNQVILETYGPADGLMKASQTLALKNVSGDFYDIPTIIGEQGGLIYLNIDQNIYSLDLAFARLKKIY